MIFARRDKLFVSIHPCSDSSKHSLESAVNEKRKSTHYVEWVSFNPTEIFQQFSSADLMFRGKNQRKNPSKPSVSTVLRTNIQHKYDKPPTESLGFAKTRKAGHTKTARKLRVDISLPENSNSGNFEVSNTDPVLWVDQWAPKRGGKVEGLVLTSVVWEKRKHDENFLRMMRQWKFQNGEYPLSNESLLQ